MVNKHVFWQALLISVFVFGTGIFGGYLLEDHRSNLIETSLIQTEIDILDEQLRNKMFNEFNVSCDISIESTFSFADDIYQDALKLEEYENAENLGGIQDAFHRRYDLLRLMLWTESISLKEKCEDDFHTVVYLYERNAEDLNQRAKQATFSKITFELKEKHGSEILLIPISTDSDLASMEVVLRTYNITKLPAVILDESVVINEVISLSEIEKQIF